MKSLLCREIPNNSYLRPHRFRQMEQLKMPNLQQCYMGFSHPGLEPTRTYKKCRFYVFQSGQLDKIVLFQQKKGLPSTSILNENFWTFGIVWMEGITVKAITGMNL